MFSSKVHFTPSSEFGGVGVGFGRTRTVVVRVFVGLTQTQDHSHGNNDPAVLVISLQSGACGHKLSWVQQSNDNFEKGPRKTHLSSFLRCKPPHLVIYFPHKTNCLPDLSRPRYIELAEKVG